MAPTTRHRRSRKTATATRRTTAQRSIRRVIPLDDEPPTPRDLRAIAAADAAFARGDFCTLDELENNVARLRSHKPPKRPSASVPRGRPGLYRQRPRVGCV